MFDLQAAVEEGIVVGGGSALLRLASKVDAIKETLDNYEQQVFELLHFKSHVNLFILTNTNR
jgi:chaperonin GroEL